VSRYIGIDLGGTAIKHGVVDQKGTVLTSGSTRTPDRGREGILSCMAEIARRYMDLYPILGIGVGTAGAVDFARGRVLGHSPNIPGWGDTPVRELLLERLDLPVAVDNDANCMALAEMHAGAGRGCRSAFFLTLGTGIGSAVVVDGRLLRGAHSLGGEWGHSTIVHNGRMCACGRRGHLEAYASAPALVRRTLELARQGLPSVYAELSDAAAGALDSEEVFKAAAAGDAAAAQALTETASYLADGIASAVNLLDPERIVLGGGMAVAGSPFVGAVVEEVRTRVHSAVTPYVDLVTAELGNRAGFIGAALLLLDSMAGTAG